jgi:drug/metabolite transporter (DMT)-like permease
MAISDNLRGVAYMCLSMMAFTFNDSFMKAVTQEVPLFQTVFLRGLLAISGLVVMGLVTGAFRQPLKGADWRLISLRSLAEIFATVTFLIALLHMQFANLSAIMQALPLAVTLGAALAFGEKIGWRRMLAILVGFVGVLIIIRPGTDAFDIWSLLGVASVLCVVVRDLSARRVASHVPSIIVALGAALAVTATAFGLSLLSAEGMGANYAGLTGWVPLSARHVGLIAGAGGFLIVGYLCAVTAMRSGDIGTVAPFRYTSLLWAILLGFVVFDEVPDGYTLLGASLVVASGLYALWRERSLRHRAAPSGG